MARAASKAGATVLDGSQWPAARTEMRPTSDLTPYARNSRQHSDEQVAQIAASIERFGFTIPVLVDETDGIIAGHGRVMAALSLGIRDVPVMVARGWSEEDRRLYVIADNKLAENASWDDDMLRLELGELRDLGADVDLTGFSAGELDALFADTAGLADPDDVPGLPAIPKSKRGDLYILGRHRLMCGDSTVAAEVEALLAGAEPHLMVTDPPYGVEYDPDWRNKAKRPDGTSYGASATGTVSNDDKADWHEAWALFPGDVAYVWHAGLFSGVVADSLMSQGFQLRSQIIWAKSIFAIGRGDYHWQHEPCWYAVRRGRSGQYDGGRKQSTLWQIDKPQKSETGHGTQKPVECMRRPIENNSAPGDKIYEPFSGSGTTIIAAEMTGRSCYAIELSPQYVDVAVKRWQDFTGQKAELVRAAAAA